VEADAKEQAYVAWTQWWSVRRWRWTRQVIGEAVSEALAMDPMTVSLAMAVQAWR
jgi:hypothetical protein